MLRKTSFRIGLLGIVGSLLLLLSLLTFTGAASAKTVDANQSNVNLRPHLDATVVGQMRGPFIVVKVSGTRFRQGIVVLYATAGRRTLNVYPAVVRTDRRGSFTQYVRIYIPYRSHPTQIAMHAMGRYGEASDTVTLYSRPYRQPWFGQ
jgi:hypothetical protein